MNVMAFGALKLARFSTLNSSARNCRVSRPRSCVSFRNERDPGPLSVSLPDSQRVHCRLVAYSKVVKRTIVEGFFFIKVRTSDMTPTTQCGCSARTAFCLKS